MGTKPPFVPTPARIEATCHKIRAGWTEAEAAYRAAYMPQEGGPAGEAAERLAVYPQTFHVTETQRGSVATPTGLPAELPDGRGGERAASEKIPKTD